MSMRHWNVKAKLMIVQLSVMLLAVASTGVAVGVASSRALREQALEIVSQTSGRIAEEIEHRMRDLEQTARSLPNDGEVARYLHGAYTTVAEEYSLHRRFVARAEDCLLSLGDDAHIGVTRYSPGLKESISGGYHNRLKRSPSGNDRVSSYQLIGLERQLDKQWFRDLYYGEPSPSRWTRIEEDAVMGWVTYLYEADEFDIDAPGMRKYALIELSVPVERFLSAAGSSGGAVQYGLTLGDELLCVDADVAEALSRRGTDWPEAASRLDGWTTRSQPIGDTGLRLLTFVPDGHLSVSANVVLRLIVLMCLLSAGGVLLVSFLTAESFSRRINVVCRAMERLQEGSFDRRLEIRVYDEIGYLMSAYNRMCARIQKLIEDLEQAHREKNEASVRALQAQIHPHFLYNSLTTVVRLAEAGRIDDLKAVIYSLVRFYRMALNQSGELITIAEEMEHVREYMKICAIRFGEYAEMEVNVDEAAARCLIVPITIQPFVENVFKHAIRDDGRVTHVEVNAYDAVREIHIFILDDGVGVDESQCEKMRTPPANGERQGYGVYNVNERLRLHFGEGYGARVRPAPGGGTEVKITIPKIRKNDAEGDAK